MGIGRRRPGSAGVAFSIAFSSALLASVAIAQVSPQGGTSLTLDPFDERYVDEVPVSGRLIVGLQVHSGGKPRLPPLLALPEQWAEKSRGICVQATTRDGRYTSKGTLKPDTLRGSRAPRVLRYFSKYGSKLEGAKSDEIAFLAIEGDCNSVEREPRLFVVDLRAIDPANARASDSALELFVNSGRMPTEVAYTDRFGQPRRHACTPIQEGVRRAFDARCSMTDLEQRPGGSAVELHQRRFERKLDPQTVVIHWGP